MSEAVNGVVKKERPEFRNIHLTDIARYRMPLAALVSVLHRISGALIFLMLPFILYLLDSSLTSEISFDYFKGFASGWFVKLIILVLSWSYLHHFCAGIRHLVMDTHMGLDKDSARKSAMGVLVVSLFLAVLVALKLFGVF
ncbi:MAG: succinate dehydrogenase, cytochrome b556 subunit [Glaciimonas sp.]|nr:succinate dehydrogenase, cytochrome b556 subunit [Glaciimonas sp.]